jgi:hypothetical protein
MRPVLASFRANGCVRASATTARRRRCSAALRGREEARGAARHAQVLDRGGVALGVVAVDERFARLAGGDERELPAEVARVLDAVVAAARAERADDVRRVANEDRAADAKRVEQVVAVLVRADPDELELDVGAELRAQALPRDLGLADRLRIGVLVHLVVEPPDGVGHQVLPDAAPFVERRVDPGPALDLQGLFETDVGDAPAVGVARHVRLDPERVADPAVRAGRVDEPVGLERVRAGRRLDVHDRAVARVLDADDLRLPADRALVELADAIDEEPLEIELLQVDERRLLGASVVLEVERVDLVGAGERATDRPRDPLGADPFVDAEAGEDLEALLRVADAARRRAANADGVVLVEDDDGDAAQQQVARERQTREAAARDHDRIADPLARVEVGRAHMRPGRQLVFRRELPDLGSHIDRYSASANAAISSATRCCRSSRPAR